MVHSDCCAQSVAISISMPGKPCSVHDFVPVQGSLHLVVKVANFGILLLFSTLLAALNVVDAKDKTITKVCVPSATCRYFEVCRRPFGYP